jgi:hypothetical protein
VFVAVDTLVDTEGVVAVDTKEVVSVRVVAKGVVAVDTTVDTEEVVSVRVVAKGVVAVDTTVDTEGVVSVDTTVDTEGVVAVDTTVDTRGVVAVDIKVVAMGGPKVDTEQDGRHSLSFHRGEKATRALIQPDPMSAGSLSKLSSFSVSRLIFQSAAKGFLNIYYTTLYSN